ncbi:related to SYF2 - pre-mRNA-splicing factor [Ustilago trichophora]|uniref:Pre-mRNA-splicing factor SYF2 n=1 Tax=Ustilago trichophora TaxID=86804 RepID=A0A5C3DRP7_9BASI|nr:related to SYF2 - pre-mRNA-splicing factor [Ustilago trichophora]
MPTRRTRAAQKAHDHHDAAEEQVKVAESSSTAAPLLTTEVQFETTSSTATKPKGKSLAVRHQPLLPSETIQSSADASSSNSATLPQRDESTSPSSSTITMSDRQARLTLLRAKMASSTRANRQAILSEQSRSRTIASELKSSSSSRKLEKAEKLLEERDLLQSGQDVERHRNMHYSLEDSQAWDAKLEAKEKRKDHGPGDFGDAAERAYQRQLRSLKPERASETQDRHQDQLNYGSHIPTQDAIDRVVSHLNHERQIIQNRSRTRQDDPDAEINYINDSNKHFNKKLKRYYDKQTKEIRENLERGTAL